MSDQDRIVAALLERAGRTYAAEAGIAMADTPAPLYRLLVLSTLLSTRIASGLAVDATRELVKAGMGTPAHMRDARWRDRVDALGRAHYRRYDERTATALGDGAQLALDEYRGDLRGLRVRAEREPTHIRALLTDFPRLGPVGADIFLREAQQVWPELRPAFDGKVMEGARRLGLPTSTDELAGLVDDDRVTTLAAGLVRVALDEKLAEQIRTAE